MRILMLGSDALAGLLAAELVLEDHDVTVLAEGERYDQLRWHGIRLRDADSGAEETVPVRAVDRVSPEEMFDLLVATHDVAEQEGLLPPPPWAATADILVLPQDAERASTILGESEIDFRNRDAHFDGDTVVYRMEPQARLTPIGREAPVEGTVEAEEAVSEATAVTVGAMAEEAVGDRGAAPDVLGEPHGWLPTTPPEPGFEQPPAVELPAPEPPRGMRAPAMRAFAPEAMPIEEDLLVAHVGESWLPIMPEAAEGDTPWPEPMTPPELQHYDEEVRRAPRYGRWPWVIAGVAVWLGWRMLRRRRR